MRILILSMNFCILLYNFFMFGKKLKELRLEKGLTQEQIANILSCHQSMITRWEKEECEPTETIIKKTAIYFGVSADFLLGLEDDTGSKIYNNYGTHNGDVNFK